MITGVLEAISAVSNLIAKTLPDDELKREQFKLKYPKIYQRIIMSVMRKAVRDCKRLGIDKTETKQIEMYVRLIKMDKDFEALLIERLNK